MPRGNKCSNSLVVRSSVSECLERLRADCHGRAAGGAERGRERREGVKGSEKVRKSLRVAKRGKKEGKRSDRKGKKRGEGEIKGVWGRKGKHRLCGKKEKE